MFVLMDTGDRHEIVSTDVVMMEDRTIRLVHTTEPGLSVTIEVTRDDLLILAGICAGGAAGVDDAKRILDARDN